MSQKPYLEKLIHPSHGFIAGRNIANYIRQVIDIIDFTEQEKIPAILIALDFEKAFDRVEHDSLYETLRFLNFGDNFINGQSCYATTFNYVLPISVTFLTGFILHVGYSKAILLVLRILS